MIYQRYFKSGQSLILKTQNPQDTEGRTELLSATLDSGEDTTYILYLPYAEDAANQYPFTPELLFEISSEAMGLGVRVTGRFEKQIDGQRIAVKIQPDLQMFQRRNSPRLDCCLGIRFSRGQGTLKDLRETWEKNIKVLQSPKAPFNLEGFNPCQVNISNGGIRFSMRPPVNLSDLCLMLIDLDDGKVPICAITEIAWCRPEQDETILITGMRFINILKEDQKRIDKFLSAKNAKPEA